MRRKVLTEILFPEVTPPSRAATFGTDESQKEKGRIVSEQAISGSTVAPKFFAKVDFAGAGPGGGRRRARVVAGSSGRNPSAGSAQQSPTAPARFALEPEAKVFAQYAGSESCRECHAAAFDKWKGSHHGLAERKIDPRLDRGAFEPSREIKAGTQVSEARTDDGKFQLITTGLKSSRETLTPDRVIGVDPLRQFLIPTERGRWQTAELAWDPHRQEWFDVYGNEDRQPGEWGHWTGRGMMWNQMCASCHNTRVRKNYESTTDSYHTTMAGMTVGCEACHGPMRAHVEWRKKYPGAERRSDAAEAHARANARYLRDVSRPAE